ncbi:hypothetical protein [Pelagicoccus mobilis]|uniref:Uncharacterized protein n=1 Tax=Pelagicoccus mobilis TaxID=415221 RepID=A0A934RVW4_9BACT|nr:hypothetical protein [Pelagicoccus mobilis]MBK1875382.1 hypothetical protein [Pelagicoccus mobilis]
MSDSSPLSSHSRERKSFYKRPLFVGCLGFLVLVALLIGGGIFWLINSGKTVITNEIRKEIVEEIENSGLPEAQQAALKSEIDRITEGFQEGDITFEELMQIIESLEQSPALSVIKYYEAEGNPLERPSITDAQRESAMLTIRRFVFGVFEKRIPDTAVEDILEPFILDSSRGDGIENLEFRTDITDEELFAALAKAKQMADDAGIRRENLSPDIAREVREIVDRILEGRE